MLALSVAAQREQRGNTQIQVFLLDTIFDDQYLSDIKSAHGYVSGLEEDYLMFLELQKYPIVLTTRSAALLVQAKFRTGHTVTMLGETIAGKSSLITLPLQN